MVPPLLNVIAANYSSTLIIMREAADAERRERLGAMRRRSDAALR